VVERSATWENTDVGLEDRDWYPSKAWKDLWGTVTQPQPRRRRSYRPYLQRIAIAAGVAAIAAFALHHRAQVEAITDRAASMIQPAGAESVEPPSAAPFKPSFDAKLVRLRQRPGLDVPATAVTRWTVRDPRFGRIDVLVPIGRTPREALTVALAERGFQVVG
jgi:hypothetical protein